MHYYKRQVIYLINSPLNERNFKRFGIKLGLITVES